MTPSALSTHRDRIIAERGWTADAEKIVNTKYHAFSNHRSIIAHELRTPDVDWMSIARCLGFCTAAAARAAADRHEQAEKDLKLARELAFDQRRAEQYGTKI